MIRSIFVAAAALTLGVAFGACASPLPGGQAHMLRMPQLAQTQNMPPHAASVVGLWHTVNNLPDGEFFLEAYTLWHGDGTFTESANRPPATGSISMGVWTQEGNTITLSRAVAWLYDTNNTFTGTLSLTETYTLKDRGDKLVGTFDAKFYDTSGNLLQEVTGSSKADRLD